MDEDHKPDRLKNRFTQFIADNVECNTDTMDVRYLPWDGYYCLCGLNKGYT